MLDFTLILTLYINMIVYDVVRCICYILKEKVQKWIGIYFRFIKKIL